MPTPGPSRPIWNGRKETVADEVPLAYRAVGGGLGVGITECWACVIYMQPLNGGDYRPRTLVPGHLRQAANEAFRLRVAATVG